MRWHRKEDSRLGALVVLLTIAALTAACRSAQTAGPVRLTVFEYNRGASSPDRSDLVFGSGANQTRFHDVRLEGQSFYDDNSIVPNSFLGPLARGEFKKALNAFTEPYYGYRLLHFLRAHPTWAVGVEFTHHKAFMADPDQRTLVTGPWSGLDADGRTRLGDQFRTLNVSHGVNHVAFVVQRRWQIGRAHV